MPRARWVVTVAAAVWGVITVGWWTDHWAWPLATGVVFGVPILAQLGGPTLRAVGLWWSVLLVGQSLLAPLLATSPLVLPPAPTLPPDYEAEVRIAPGLFPGLQGPYRVTTDRRGYRTMPPVDYRSPPAGVRIVAVGGSTTEQLLLDDERTWSHRLQERLATRWGRPVEVVNTGVSGLRASHHLATLRSLADVPFDLAIVLVGVNDWNAQARDEVAVAGGRAAVRRGWRAALARIQQGHGLPVTPVGSAVRAVGRGAFRLVTRLAPAEGRLGRWLRRVGPRDRRAIDWGVAPDGEGAIVLDSLPPTVFGGLDREPVASFRPAAVAPAYDRFLEAMAATCRARGIGCLFVTQPHAYRRSLSSAFRSRLWMTPSGASWALDLDSLIDLAALYNDHLRSAMPGRGVSVCDAAAAFDDPELYLVDDVHFNDAGSARLAEVLEGCVSEELGWLGRSGGETR